MEKMKIGLSCSPSKILSHEKMSVTKVLLTYGGGMGGASETHYCTDVLERVTDTPVSYTRLTTIKGEVIEVNPRYIVKKTKVNLVKMVDDSTAHANYYAPKVKKSISINFIELQQGQDYEVDSTSYESRKNVIHTDGEITPL